MESRLLKFPHLTRRAGENIHMLFHSSVFALSIRDPTFYIWYLIHVMVLPGGQVKLTKRNLTKCELDPEGTWPCGKLTKCVFDPIVKLTRLGTWPSVNLIILWTFKLKPGVNLTKLGTWPWAFQKIYHMYGLSLTFGQVHSLVKFTLGQVHSVLKFTLVQVPTWSSSILVNFLLVLLTRSCRAWCF